MKLTKNFNSEEFACKDGSQVPTAYLPNLQKLANNLQVLRDHVGKPILINSGYRTAKYNKSVGGATDSQHKTASAGDIRIAGMTPKEVYTTILNLISEGKMHNGGLGLYNSFVHYDIRKTVSRWD